MIVTIKQFFTKTIRNKLIVTVVLTHTIMMSIFVYDLTSNQKEFLHKQSLSQVISFATTLSKNSTSWVLSNDFIGMEEIVDSIKQYPDLNYAMLLDKKGKVLSHTQKKFNNLYVSDPISLKILNSKVVPLVLLNNESSIDIAVPILRANQHIGWARIGVAQNENSLAITKVINQGIIYTIIAILIGFAFSYILAKELTSGLHNLINIAKQTTFGTLHLRADVSSNDEVGLLSKEVNRMLDRIAYDEKKLAVANEKLSQDIEELENMDKQLTLSNQNLEKKIAEKTNELQHINDNLESEIENAVEVNRQKDQLLFQQSKMAAMGEMLENIAHQWRQPLSVITTASTGIQIQKEMDMLTDEVLDDSVAQITDSAMHLSDTIDDFRSFFKVDKEKNSFSLLDAMEKTQYLMSSKFKNRDIYVINNCEDIEFLGYKNEMIQAFMNILNNAEDALEECDRDSRFIFVDMKIENDSIFINIKDSAGGISKENISHIFNEHFTTKSDKNGTGIGLYMTHMIIDKTQGTIEVTNKTFEHEGKIYTGANFLIKIPVVQN